MLFAAIFDAGLIPFFVFTAMISHQQYLEPSGFPGHWQTLFGDDRVTPKIIYSTFLISVTDGGIHLVSLCISVYLAVIFRKIAKLPPDLNPLEDNLTSRHKRNKSSLSTATVEVNNRDSHLSAPLIDAPRMIPFMHTRTESSTRPSPQRRPVHSHQNSQTETPLYQQPRSQRSSRADLLPSPERFSKRMSQYTDPRSPSPRPASTHSSLDDNWVSYPSPSPSPPTAGPAEVQHLRPMHHPPCLSPGPQPRINKYDFTNRSPRPLEMNPPTPPINSYNRGQDRTLAPTSGNVVWYEDPNTPQRQQQPQHGRGDSYGAVRDKTRYYGNLHACKGRVVSSGAKVEERGGLRGREVSGKVVEEGRALRY